LEYNPEIVVRVTPDDPFVDPEVIDMGIKFFKKNNVDFVTNHFYPTFPEGLDIEKFVDDDVNYLSDTNSYINATYFDSKVRDVKPDVLEEYKTRDILEEASGLIGINRKVCEANDKDSGGAQYILKNIDADFWYNVMEDCLKIRTFLQTINGQYFGNESKGFQSWCADMWSILWNLWARDRVTKVVPEMEFAWATDPIEKLNRCTIFHNAGIASTEQNGHPCFYKGKYHTGTDPMIDPHLDNILNNEKSQKFCTWWYTSKLKELDNKYHLQY